jgi:hypothetical protein
MRLVLFVHVLGIAMWIGGGLAGMVLAFSAREETADVRAGTFRMLGRLHAMVIGFGALLTLGSGVILTMTMYSEGLGDLFSEAKLWVMIVTGLLAGLIVLFVGLPTASRLSALSVASDKGTLPPAFEIYRKRMAVVSSVAGVLAVISLLSWYLL